MQLVSEKFANQPRKVLPESFEDIPADVMKLLSDNGIAEDDILLAFEKRN